MAKHDEFAGDGTVSGDAILDGIIGNDIGLLEAVDLPIIVISRDRSIVRINRAAITVLGVKLTDIGRSIDDSLRSVENLGRLCARVIADGAPHRTEARDGDRCFLLRVAPYRGSDRQILGAVVTLTNVTAFRASIDQAIYEREYTKAILNAVIDPLVVLDDKLHVQTANRAFHILFGVSRDKTQGISIRKLGDHEWETSEAWASVEASLGRHTQFKTIEIEGELPVIGRRIFVLDAHELGRDRNTLIVLTFHDVTERKQAERTTSLLAAIVDCSDDAIISKKLDGTITSWNNSAERLFGYSAGEAIGELITLIIPWERRSEEEDILRRLAQGEVVDHFETVRKRKDGTTLDVSLTISPIRDAAGRVIGASKVARDITDRKRAERALAEQARLLDLSNDAIFVRDAADRVTYWNSAATELYGFTREEALGQVSHDLLCTQFPAALEEIKEQLHREERWSGELVHVRKDGTEIIVASRWALDQRGGGDRRCVLETNNDITQQKRTEKALRESEERFRAIVETTPECVKLLAADGTLLHMNLSGLQMVGARSGDEVAGRSVYDLVAPEDRERYKSFNESICRGERGSLQFAMVGLDGNRRYMETHAAPLRNSDETIIHLAVTSDISQRKQAEQALRESEQRYRTITEATPIMVWMSGLDKACFYFNKGWLDFVGRTLEQEVGNGWAEGVHPDDFDRCLQIYVSSFDARRSFEMHYRLRHRTGQYRWILDCGVPRYTPDGIFEGYVGGCLDIHDQKEADELLRRSEERFRALVNASSDVVYYMSPDWSEMRQLDGKGFIADTGKPRRDWLDEYIDVADQPLVLKSIREALRTKSMFELEHRIRRKDGTMGWTYSRAVPLLDANGAIMEWFGAASDVTVRKEAEEKYRKLVQTLDAEVRARTRELEEQSNQVRKLSWRLLRTQDEERRHIARELHDSAGQTLTVLGINLAQLAQKAGRNAPELAIETEQIQETVQQLHREIRTTSYLLHPPLLDESGLYSAISWYIQGLQERSGLEVHLDCSEKFGRLPREVELVIFRLVQECLTNIHRHSGSKTASIRLTQDVNQITLEIQDQGKGMAAERLAEVQSGRSGVGVTGMRERLRQVEGTLDIESGELGTRVFAMIPVAKSAATDDQKKDEPMQAAV
ncbi:MAG TPA: PAS domain S-box protein [Candidatus Sulfotelmatobacter sp.]|jgi:PAS domain S-box-containing protein